LLLLRCGGTSGGDTATASSEANGPGGVTTCTLTPKQEDGPFYVDVGLVRSDVRETEIGVVLSLAITVLDATTCAPVANAAVDIWSANPLGVYSDEASERTARVTYLRGIQITDSRGQATFTTLYPGWYAGRAIHVHVKVHIGGVVSGATYSDGSAGKICHTGQMFFDQADNDLVKLAAPYTSNRNTYVTEAEDPVYMQENGSESVLTLAGSPASGYTATIRLMINQSATNN
jgi:protocatechuate 3,4-dioxygenase beta subunit